MLGKNQALIVVDIQRDFCAGGTLAVKDTDSLVVSVNQKITQAHQEGIPVIFSKDFHPESHISFKINGGNWVKHCVANTVGSCFHPQLYVPENSIFVYKGVHPDKEAYSAFEETGLEQILHSLQVQEVFVVGIASDYCVKATALDSIQYGFSTRIIKSLTRAVNDSKENMDELWKELETKGVHCES